MQDHEERPLWSALGRHWDQADVVEFIGPTFLPDLGRLHSYPTDTSELRHQKDKATETEVEVESLPQLVGSPPTGGTNAAQISLS